jgi:peptidoglycan/LPS O-acetylase OafA/YrhL
MSHYNIFVRLANQVNQVNQVNQSSPYKSSYRSEIDGLRAFAVLSVVAFHAFPYWLKGGFIGVDVFFVISGFLITSHIFENLDKGQFSLLDFYGRRIRRIFPALLLTMVCTLSFGWFVLLADEYNQLGMHVASGAAFVSNFIFANEVGYFDIDSELKPMLHLWSLAVEEQFYILFPLLLLLASKLRVNLLFVCLVVLFASFFVNLYFVNRFPTETFFWPFGRFWELLVGSLLAWLTLYRFSINTLNLPKSLVQSYRISLVGKWLSQIGFFTLIGLLLLAASVFLIDKSILFPSYTAVWPVLGASLVIMGGGMNYIAKLFLCNKLAVWFGLISYPLYLWHWPILSYLHIIEDGTPHREKRILAVLLSIVLAWVTFKFVEKPIRFGTGNKTKRTVALGLGIFVIALLGLWVSNLDLKETKGSDDIYLRDGLQHRIGSTSRWYKGQGDWLFLGNTYNDTVAKLKLAFQPSAQNISNEVDRFEALAQKALESNTKVALLVGPNKSSVYREYLPNEIMPSERRYSTFITDKLKDVSNLLVVDPTNLLISSKSTEGLLYWRFGTHWNYKGAFLAFESLMNRLALSVPNIDFSYVVGKKLNGIPNFPMTDSDEQEWSFEIKNKSQIYKEADKYQLGNEHFGWKEKIINTSAPNDLSVWVIGDSFTQAVRPYIEASFKDVRYIGHWSRNIDSLGSALSNSAEKPDLVLIVRVERSF